MDAMDILLDVKHKCHLPSLKLAFMLWELGDYLALWEGLFLRANCEFQAG